MKKIIFIPPNGKFKKQDFSLQRILKYLVNESSIEAILVYIKSSNVDINTLSYNKVIEVNTQQDILDTIKNMEYDVIFHRSWMGAYEFGAKLVKELDNVVVNIKDWNFASKDIYEFLYPQVNDYEAIEYIFRHSKKVLSHFTKEQVKLWAEEYQVDEEKFYFFPEFCNESEFNKKPATLYEDIHLVYAGAIQPTIRPEDYFPGKSHLRSIRLLSAQHIKVDFVLPQDVYDFTVKSNELYQDFLYENSFNNNFNIIKGDALNSSILNKYHFGFFELETTGVNHMLYKYAITSKFAFYLEASLPMLVNDKFVAIAQLVSRYKLGIVFSNRDLNNINNKLNISQKEYNKFIKNIEKYRKLFIYKTKILDEMFAV